MSNCFVLGKRGIMFLSIVGTGYSAYQREGARHVNNGHLKGDKRTLE